MEFIRKDWRVCGIDSYVWGNEEMDGKDTSSETTCVESRRR